MEVQRGRLEFHVVNKLFVGLISECRDGCEDDNEERSNGGREGGWEPAHL